jgi:hypothetical protein
MELQSASDAAPIGPLVFCVPIYNDWDCAAALLTQIDAVVMANRWNASVLFIDDGSTDSLPSLSGQAVTHVEILRLRQNLGHQRAIAIALAYLYIERQFEAAIIMDGDGEDAPRDVPDLLQTYARHHGERLVFAKRSRRSEGITFKAGYQAFKALHWILTGRRVEVGNFSILPRQLLERLVAVSELWNHYAAACLKARLPHDMVPIARAKRLGGKSKMNFVRLVSHGLSALSVYGEEIGARLLAASSATIALSTICLLIASVIKLAAPLAIPQWTLTAAGILLLVLLDGLILSMMFCFLVLHGRTGAAFLPLRDYSYYLLTEQTAPANAGNLRIG